MSVCACLVSFVVCLPIFSVFFCFITFIMSAVFATNKDSHSHIVFV